MSEPKLIDPRKLYHTEGFQKQDQDTPAVQKICIRYLIVEKRLTKVPIN